MHFNGTLQALELADEAGTDVVLISPDAEPPVVRLIEVSKLKYEQEKAKKEAGRKSRAARCALNPKPEELRTVSYSAGCAAGMCPPRSPSLFKRHRAGPTMAAQQRRYMVYLTITA
jgi:hypothetical protein